MKNTQKNSFVVVKEGEKFTMPIKFFYFEI